MRNIPRFFRYSRGWITGWCTRGVDDFTFLTGCREDHGNSSEPPVPTCRHSPKLFESQHFRSTRVPAPAGSAVAPAVPRVALAVVEDVERSHSVNSMSSICDRARRSIGGDHSNGSCPAGTDIVRGGSHHVRVETWGATTLPGRHLQGRGARELNGLGAVPSRKNLGVRRRRNMDVRWLRR